MKMELKMSQRKPTIVDQQICANKAILTLKIDAVLADFEGHFPNYPLLPGVTQIDWAIFYGKKLLINSGTRFAGMEVIKFQDPILPDSIVLLTLTWNTDKQKLSFSYHAEACQYSSGRIKLLVSE